MNGRLILCSVVVLVASLFAQPAWAQKKGKSSAKKTTVVSNDSEIDNYDFLYADDGYDPTGGETINHVMDEAFAHLGARYSLGSKGPNAFDCSGFTSYVFGRNDFTIGVSSRDQYAKNMPIKRNELQRGDLVFFTSAHSGRGVGHVGIVVDVDPATNNFTFIHASTSQGVKVSSSTESYYGRRYLGARRVF